jgi:hypothetical protein
MYAGSALGAEIPLGAGPLLLVALMRCRLALDGSHVIFSKDSREQPNGSTQSLTVIAVADPAGLRFSGNRDSDGATPAFSYSIHTISKAVQRIGL